MTQQQNQVLAAVIRELKLAQAHLDVAREPTSHTHTTVDTIEYFLDAEIDAIVLDEQPQQVAVVKGSANSKHSPTFPQ